MCAEDTWSMGWECYGTSPQCCCICATSLFSSLTWGSYTEQRFLVTLPFSRSTCFFWCFICVCIDSAYLQACLMCFLFFTEEERQLQANNRDFNLQFEYAVSNKHMLLHADVLTDVAASASCLECSFKGVTSLHASCDSANKASMCHMNHRRWLIAESATGSSAFGVNPANGQSKEI